MEKLINDREYEAFQKNRERQEAARNPLQEDESEALEKVKKGTGLDLIKFRSILYDLMRPLFEIL